MKKSLVAIVGRDGEVKLFERIEHVGWNCVEYQPVECDVIRASSEPFRLGKSIVAAVKFAANQATSLLLSWMIG